MTRTILAVVAHPDDETIGCGGALHRHFRSGDAVFAMCATNGVGSRVGPQAEAVARRREDSKRAASILGFEWAAELDFPDNALDAIALLELARAIESVKARIQPDIVYTHAAHDLNIDHRRIHEAVRIAFRPQPSDAWWTEIRCFEIPSATDWGHEVFEPDLFIEITSSWVAKRAALECYGDELRPPPHSRSMSGIQALCTLRGHQAGFHMAEAFQTPIRRLREETPP